MQNDDDSATARVLFLWLPMLVSLVAIVISIAIDHLCHGRHFTSRSGSIIALCGAVSGYGGATRIWIRRGDLIRGVRDVPYGKIGLALGLVGTFLWGYGDLWL